MIMTNYMDLLAANQPWNLILFMVLPVTMAEALVATEFYTMYIKDKADSCWKQWNHWLGIHAAGAGWARGLPSDSAEKCSSHPYAYGSG